jgi:hypothetical protein
MSATREHASLDEWAHAVMAEHDLTLVDEIRRSTYDFSERLRNIVFEVRHADRPAVMKIYDDELINVEADSLQQFHETNRSDFLTAPQLYLSDIVSLTSGWLVIEKLPDDGRFLDSPLGTRDRERFVDAFVEYREHFPREPNRPLALAESQDAFQFHSFRLASSLEKASIRERQRAFADQPTVLEREEFMPRMKAVLDQLRTVFDGKPLHWAHGHFKPIDVYEFPDAERWALTDFGHTKMLPDGYEPAFAIWWDRMIVGVEPEFEDWRREIGDWADRFLDRMPGLGADVMRASLLERAVATILESVVLEQDMPDEERRQRLELLYRLIDGLLRG